MWRILGLALLVGCDALFGIHELRGDAGHAGQIDGRIDGGVHGDGPLDAPRSTSDTPGSGAGCFGSQGSGSASFHFCLTAPPAGPLALPSSPYDTSVCGSEGVTIQLLGQTVCVLAGTSATVDDFVAVGAYPLVIASTTDVLINGTLDVSTQSGAQHGAGSSPALSACDGTSSLNGASNTSGGGGGAGGSFGTLGGQGGNGGQAGGTAGAPNPTQTPTALRGGCPGGIGGNGMGGTGGNQAWPGGAVWVVAYGAITISGAINASGENGFPGTQGGNGAGAAGGGASGGASGGMILLDAASLSVTGNLVADGGGGGGGGDSTNGGNGNDGSVPNVAGPSMQASGGNGGGTGGNGGRGAATSGNAQNGGNGANVSGGGGGGGGMGVIWVISGGVPGASNNISPNAAAAP